MTREKSGYPLRQPQLDAGETQVWNWAQNETLGDRAAVKSPPVKRNFSIFSPPAPAKSA